MLGWIFIVLTHWNNSPRVEMSLHSDTLFWFRASQSLLFLLNAAYLAEKHKIKTLKFLVWPDLSCVLTIYHTRGEHANHYATNTVANIESRSHHLCYYMYCIWLIYNINLSTTTTPYLWHNIIILQLTLNHESIWTVYENDGTSCSS